MVIDSIARDLESNGIDLDVVTDNYIVIFNAEDWMQDEAHDILDLYLSAGRILNYRFDNPYEEGLPGFDRTDLGIVLTYELLWVTRTTILFTL